MNWIFITIFSKHLLHLINLCYLVNIVVNTIFLEQFNMINAIEVNLIHMSIN